MKFAINEKFSSMIIELKVQKQCSMNDVIYTALQEYYDKYKKTNDVGEKFNNEGKQDKI